MHRLDQASYNLGHRHGFWTGFLLVVLYVLVLMVVVAHAEIQPWYVIIGDINFDPRAGSDSAHPALINLRRTQFRYDVAHACQTKAEELNIARASTSKVYYTCTSMGMGLPSVEIKP
jgi:hypothetical protein